ncbi:MAG: amidophosphoribosyltransferase [Gammaproteobacteria bacterium]|nr:amidophosphoribosyltransferase [Gammaproteobacteria bacterium]
MCGIIGIVGRSPVNQALYDGLTILQHRGQDAAGIVTSDGERLYLRKNNGMVRDVFHTRHMLNLRGNLGIGHVRYPTAGCSSSAEAQPFYVNSPYGIALAHNGNLINTDTLHEDLATQDLRHLNTDSDSEVLLNVFAHELQEAKKQRRNLRPSDIFAAVSRVHARCSGGYAAVAMITGVGIVGFRDPHGIRPAVFGERTTDIGKEYMIASESVAVHALGFSLLRDIHPGEAVFLSAGGELHAQQCAERAQYSPCIFEYVYLARPDSIIDDISVYKSRLRMGKALARKIQRLRPDHDIDVVIPIPDTGRTSALPLAHKLGVKYREGFVKNRYIPRTFIMPGQNVRRKSVRQKLNAINLEFKNKVVLLVDDSIVRGTTSREIIQLAREAGARKVYFASAAPPVRFPNVYGIDIPTQEELIAWNRTEEEVAALIGADWLIYQDVADLVEAARAGNRKITRFDTSCFTGEYVTGDVSDGYLAHISGLRNDAARQILDSGDESILGLSNSA